MRPDHSGLLCEWPPVRGPGCQAAEPCPRGVLWGQPLSPRGSPTRPPGLHRETAGPVSARRAICPERCSASPLLAAPCSGSSRGSPDGFGDSSTAWHTTGCGRPVALNLLLGFERQSVWCWFFKTTWSWRRLPCWGRGALIVPSSAVRRETPPGSAEGTEVPLPGWWEGHGHRAHHSLETGTLPVCPAALMARGPTPGDWEGCL